MAQHARNPLPKSLPPLSFGDPALDEVGAANDNAPRVSAPSHLRRSAVPFAKTMEAPAPPRESIPALTFGSLPPPAPAPPAAPAAPAPETQPGSIDALLAAIPSIPPQNDPSFGKAEEPPKVEEPAPAPPPAALAPPPAPPEAWHQRAWRRFDALVDRAVERAPDVSDALLELPPEVAYGVSLVALVIGLGVSVRTARGFFAALSALF